MNRLREVTEAVIDLDGKGDLDDEPVLDGGTDSVGDKEGLPEGEPVNELVLVRNRLDSELHGLGDGEKESDGEAEVERLPDDDEVVVILGKLVPEHH